MGKTLSEYNFHEIEKKWQRRWHESGVHEAGEDPGKKKYYCLEMLPYPSGAIHMGHVRNYSIGDLIARYMRRKGFNVLHPIGWDSLGMPAENAAIQKKVQPREWTGKNIAVMKKQLLRMGFSYAWKREIATYLPSYYRWNQWIFLRMMEKGLVYRQQGMVNWCPSCRTVLANEQVESGACWRCDTPNEVRYLNQWFLKITDYAERLLQNLDLLEEWPRKVVTMQRNWIGRSDGIIVDFAVEGSEEKIPVFTTRVDTIFGCTFLVISPEHPIIDKICDTDTPAFREIRQKLQRKDATEMASSLTEKTGHPIGRMAVNPYNREKIPVFMANFVVMDYGTGAVMSVPAHDQRDYEFAEKYGVPIRRVIRPADGNDSQPLTEAFTEKGVLADSGEFSGLSSEDAIKAMTTHGEKRGFGRRHRDYRLKDWGISRQRFWGTPIPVIHCDACGMVPVPYEDLPVLLPDHVEMGGEGGSPLDHLPSFVDTACPVCGAPAKRETDTMDTFFDSCWYLLRYLSPEEKTLPFTREASGYWMPVDLYIGGIEHAVMHLLYFRFFSMVLKDLGLVSYEEPVRKLLTQGMVIKDGDKMSKSKGNVVDPDELIEKYGSDTARLFMLFASPPERDLDWSEKGIEGCYKFLKRVYRTVDESESVIKNAAPFSESMTLGDLTQDQKVIIQKTHETIQSVTVDIEKRLHFNTAISAIMELVNEISRFRNLKDSSGTGGSVLREAVLTVISLLSPFAPHLAEELWDRCGRTEALSFRPWPVCREDLMRKDAVSIVVQINGKKRAELEVSPPDIDEARLLEDYVLAEERVKRHLEGKQIRKTIYVPGKLVNLVVQ